MSEKVKRKAAKAPVSAHPAFPLIVAVWFAALFGLGSLVLPAVLFERLFAATGLSALFSVAQPPLGVSARICIALIAALVGVIGGLAVARQVAPVSPKADAGRDIERGAVSAAPVAVAAKQPISAHEELGTGGIDAVENEIPCESSQGGQDALAVTEADVLTDAIAVARSPGHTGHLPSDFESEADPGCADGTAEPAFGPVRFDGAIDDEAELAAAAPFVAALTSGPRPVAEEDLGSGSQERRAFTPLASAPHAEPGIAELVARFARALESHRAGSTERAAAEFKLSPTAYEEAGSLSAQDPLDTDFGSPADRSGANGEVAPYPLGLDTGESEGENGEDEGEVDSAYSSLLTMKHPFGIAREPVRIEDDDDADAVEPVVTFPGQTMRRGGAGSPAQPRDSAETERALRDALEKLQKVSGFR